MPNGSIFAAFAPPWHFIVLLERDGSSGSKSLPVEAVALPDLTSQFLHNVYNQEIAWSICIGCFTIQPTFGSLLYNTILSMFCQMRVTVNY